MPTNFASIDRFLGIISIFLLALFFGCQCELEPGVTPESSTSDSQVILTELNPDIKTDVLRSASAPFLFQTVRTLGLNLKVIAQYGDETYEPGKTIIVSAYEPTNDK